MGVSEAIKEELKRSSWIRRMFEIGLELKARHGEENVCDLSLGNPIVEPPEEFVQILKDVVNNHQPGSHRYMPNAGYTHTRKAVADELNRLRGTKLSAAEIVMTVGAAGALNVTLKSILNPGEEVIILTPFFSEYQFYVNNHNGKCVFVDTAEDFSLDFSAIEKAITPRTKAIILNSPNNPSGVVYSDAEIKTLGELLRKCEQKFNSSIFLLSDEPYRCLVYDGVQTANVFAHYKRTVVCFSYSKELAIPGERIGYLAVNPECPEKEDLLNCMTFLNRTLGYINAPAIMQQVIARAQHVRLDISSYERQRNILVDALRKFGYKLTKPQGAFYLFPHTPIPDDIAFIKELQNELVLVVPGSGFGRPGFFRIAYCVKDEVIHKSLAGFEKVAKKFGLKG